MRVTKVMLEEANESLRNVVKEYAMREVTLKDQIKHLNAVINLYSRTPSLLIATERITQALTETIVQVKRR